MMEKLFERLENKTLSQALNILAGIIVLLLIIEKFTIVDIKIEWFNFIHFEHFILNESAMWILTILLYVNLWYSIIEKIAINIYNKKSANEDEFTSIKFFIVITTIKDILQLIASVYGFLFSVMAYSYFTSQGDCYQSFWALVTYVGILYRFGKAVFLHYYYANSSIALKSIADTKNKDASETEE